MIEQIDALAVKYQNKHTPSQSIALLIFSLIKNYQIWIYTLTMFNVQILSRKLHALHQYSH